MNTEKPATKKLPRPVVQRLTRYLARVQELRHDGQDWVSSPFLAQSLGLTSSTVRQDLSHLKIRGVSKRGYETRLLLDEIREMLATRMVNCLVIVGAGHLGCALALHGDLLGHGFEVCALFDRDPELVGTAVGPLRIRPMEALEDVVKRQRAELGVIAVPAGAAQSVADKLVAAGVHGLLNLTYTPIRAPESVTVVDARILARLQELAYLVRERRT